MNLDERIKKDLTELFEKKEISEAKELSEKTGLEVSCFGLPQHFVGDRKAKTVFGQVNPGQDVALADKSFRCLTLDYDRTSPETFIESYKDSKRRYGEIDDYRRDSFDEKQASFLKHFTDSGVEIPECFPKERTKEICLEAKKNVLMQKCQLELIPYCSANFNVNKKNLAALMPYVETLVDEIFSVERKYVIFGSAIFADLFLNLNNTSFAVDVGEIRKFEIKGMKKKCSAQLMQITKDNRTIIAVIARTFAGHSIGCAYEKMAEYGKQCYELLMKKKY